MLSFSYLFLLVGSYFLYPFWLLGYLRNYETIAGRFDSERVPCYPCNRKEITAMSDYFITVSAFFLHHHTTIIICAGLFVAWPSVCLIKAVNLAAVVSVNVVLSLLGVVV